MATKPSILALLADVTAKIASRQPVDLAPLAAEINEMVNAFDGIDELVAQLSASAKEAIRQRDAATAIAKQTAQVLSDLAVAHISKQPERLTATLDKFVREHVIQVGTAGHVNSHHFH